MEAGVMHIVVIDKNETRRTWILEGIAKEFREPAGSAYAEVQEYDPPGANENLILFVHSGGNQMGVKEALEDQLAGCRAVLYSATETARDRFAAHVREYPQHCWYMQKVAEDRSVATERDFARYVR